MNDFCGHQSATNLQPCNIKKTKNYVTIQDKEFHPNHDGCVMLYASKVQRLTTEAHNCDPTGLARQVGISKVY